MQNKHCHASSTNHKTDFVVVQSNLQSKKNYKRNNMRLEMKLLQEKWNIKDFKGFHSDNSFYKHELKNLY